MIGIILVTGGAGYIGSHAVVELIQAGYEPVIVDNVSNSREQALARIERIAGKRPDFHRADICDAAALDRLMGGRCFDAVMHFAGLKAVGESVVQPLRYYENNVGGAMLICEAMQRHGIRTMVFSSSATVYGEQKTAPIREGASTGPANPYGRTKLMIEDILRDQAASEPGWKVALLRFFNPVGAHASGLIGEDPRGVPNNLMPYACQVAVGRLAELRVFGNDYPTPDSSGVRDYIHVADLAKGHLAALDGLAGRGGVTCVNLGSGRGHSVFEVADAFERASGRNIPRRIVERRPPGDAAISCADASLAAPAAGRPIAAGRKGEPGARDRARRSQVGARIVQAPPSELLRAPKMRRRSTDARSLTSRQYIAPSVNLSSDTMRIGVSRDWASGLPGRPVRLMPSNRPPDHAIQCPNNRRRYTKSWNK